MKNLLISVATYNRPLITNYFLKNISDMKGRVPLHIYDDCSTMLDLNNLKSAADKLFINPINLGVHKTKWKQFRNFLDTSFDYLYITDSDSLHDPSFLNVLDELPKRYPISLYTSHINKDTECKEYFFRKYSGGISHFYTREMVEKIVFSLNKHGEPSSGWDYKVIDFIGKPMLVTKISYVEHLGYGGLHSGTNWDHDRAKNPTEYLQKNRIEIVNYLLEI